jgi:hypothetical protein
MTLRCVLSSTNKTERNIVVVIYYVVPRILLRLFSMAYSPLRTRAVIGVLSSLTTENTIKG